MKTHDEEKKEFGKISKKGRRLLIVYALGCCNCTYQRANA
jgi:hypothetical protein